MTSHPKKNVIQFDRGLKKQSGVQFPVQFFLSSKLGQADFTECASLRKRGSPGFMALQCPRLYICGIRIKQQWKHMYNVNPIAYTKMDLVSSLGALWSFVLQMDMNRIHIYHMHGMNTGMSSLSFLTECTWWTKIL